MALAPRTGLSLSEMAALEHLQHASGEGSCRCSRRALSLSSGLLPRSSTGWSGPVTSPSGDRIPRDRRSLVARLRPSGLEEARCHLLPVGAELLEVSKKLSDEERAAVGEYLETITEVFARHARTKG